MPDKLNMRDLAEQYGFAYAMLRSNPELERLFRRAVSQTWDQNRIMTEVRSTKWYRRHAESERNSQALRATDPATWRQKMEATRVRVQMMASEYGAHIGKNRLAALTNSAFTEAWDDNQLRKALSNYIEYSDGRLLGQAGAMEAEWRSYADQMGIQVASKTIQNWARLTTRGMMTPQDALGKIRQQAMSKYVGFKDRIRAGETVEDIADPYRQAMAEILEINPGDVNISRDRQIQSALQARNNKGKPEPMSTWEFEQRLRKDPRWRQTKNAEEGLMEVGHQVLRDFGLTN